ncbi:MAG: riboflavin biosynthesis protein RibF [Candidatus Pelagibacter sp.]|nr:riboflavin biosynthesis protein RibF [Candidatus Pelagibacter sp.]
MKIFKNTSVTKGYKNSVLAIGNFDGVHVGHKKVLNAAYKKAKEIKKKFGLLTFEPVPVMFFNKKIINHRLDTLPQKISNLKNKKLDFVIIQKFNRRFSKLSYQDFIYKVLHKEIKCKYLYVSKNFKFGNKREGNVSKLKKFEKKLFYKTIITPPLTKKKKTISSTIIRKLLKRGEIKKANYLLNRKWEVIGKVVKGSQRGRKIGFPTCNILLKKYVIPKFGVYAVNVKIDRLLKKGIANVGYRPTFNGKKLLLEVNIFGIKKNLYNKNINVIFNKFIRPEKKFKNIIELKDQIKKDIKLAK